mmetsp:Transcript_24149/g.71656  ORF Transcript_24149/g.71656 Transcript_24149/m.71656 type:complete len:216 (-) Transcript_24149:1814-2461(-)
MRLSSSAAITGPRFSALGSVSMCTPFFGWNGSTTTSAALAPTAAVSVAYAGRSTPCTSAFRMAAACTRLACVGSFPSKTSGVGKRLGADQNGAPVDVVASSGNVKMSCAMRLWKRSWKRRRAHLMQSSNVWHTDSPTSSSAAFSSCSRAAASGLARIAAAYFSGSARYVFASDGDFSSTPSKSERAQVRQWSMLCGKLCSVHIGACFSGGSRLAP